VSGPPAAARPDAVAVALLVGLVVVISACTGAGTPALRTAEVTVVGSDTMLPLNRRLAEEFMVAHPGVAVRVEGGGTARGVAALIAGEADLCAASRPLAASEIEALYARFESLGVRFLVAQDALSVYLHPDNPVRDLSLAALRAVFDGSIRSWAEVGGGALSIEVVVRPPNSGTARFFRDHVLTGGEFAPQARTEVTTADVVRAVADNPGAIGFGGTAFGRGLVHCAVEGVAPSHGSVGAGTYPLTRFLQFVAAKRPGGWVEAFVDWCLGPEGQAMVAEQGLVALWEPRTLAVPVAVP
jgi:phosphate transport system substrate-binding protein